MSNRFVFELVLHVAFHFEHHFSLQVVQVVLIVMWEMLKNIFSIVDQNVDQFSLPFFELSLPELRKLGTYELF